MTWINFDDAERQILAAGILPDKPLTIDGRIQRWKTTDSKGGERPGWSRLREWQSKAGNLYVSGAYGLWSGNDDGYTRIELPKRDDPTKPALTDEDIAAARAAQKAAAQAVAEERKREAKIAAAWAAQVWAHCEPATEHEYLVRKQIQPHGTRIFTGIGELRLPNIDDANMWRLQQAVGALVVPMHDTNGNVCGIQFIYPKGHTRAERTGKEFWPTGMAMGGTFGIIGHLHRTGVLLIVEGFATAASLAEATGQTVAYGFSANNLGKAGKQIRAKYKQLRILFCADDDTTTEAKTGSNPGVAAAQLAASEIELGAWTKPDFMGADGIDIRGAKKLTDYNDLAVLTGLPLVLANQINTRLDALKWRDAIPVRGNSSPGGGGDDLDDTGRKRAVSIMPIDELVERFVPIDDGSGKVLFDMWTARIVQVTQMTALTPAGGRGDDIKRHPRWIERGAYYQDQIGFDPSGEEKNVKLNTWRGWPMEPKKGSCEKLLALLTYLCSREGNRPDLVQWVLRWIAFPLQHAGAKMQSALILHGPQGTGKSTIFKVLADIYGDKDSYRNYSVILDQRALESQFNSDWDSKLYVLAEEVINSSDKWALKNELKELVTGHRIRIQRKFLDAYYQTNRCNITFLSNEDAPLPLDNDDRRHCVIWTPPPVSDKSYAAVREEIATGGTEAFYHYLITLDLGDFRPWSKPPMTEAKLALIAASKSSEDEFFHDWVSGETPYPVCACRGNDLFDAYIRHCQKNRERNIASRRRFRIKLAHMTDWQHRKQVLAHDTYSCTGTARQVRLEIPGESWLKRSGAAADARQASGETQAVWATRCMLDFSQALDADKEDNRAA